MAEKKFDPRFDPRYQRGYAGEPVEPVDSVDVTAGRDSRSAAAKRGARFNDASATRSKVVRADPAHRDVVGADAEHSDPERLEPDPAATEALETEALETEPVDRNPFERTLLVIALALIVGGVAAAFWANSLNFFGPGSTWDWGQLLQSSAWALSAPMVTAGLGMAIGLLFRRAIVWESSE